MVYFNLEGPCDCLVCEGMNEKSTYQCRFCLSEVPKTMSKCSSCGIDLIKRDMDAENNEKKIQPNAY